MISFTKADPYFLAELKQRCAKKTDGDPKKNRGSVFVLQLEESACKPDDEQQRRAHPTEQG
jgi:hypothetical protein